MNYHDIVNLEDINKDSRDLLVRRANKIARAAGYSKATLVVVGRTNRVLETKQHGYRKNTTDELVPNAYRAKFGWKNTYYCHAVCIVEVAI